MGGCAKEIYGETCEELIQKMVEAEGIGPSELGRRLGVSRQYAGQIISRSKYGIRCDTFEKVARATGYEITCKKLEK